MRDRIHLTLLAVTIFAALSAKGQTSQGSDQCPDLSGSFVVTANLLEAGRGYVNLIGAQIKQSVINGKIVLVYNDASVRQPKTLTVGKALSEAAGQHSTLLSCEDNHLIVSYSTTFMDMDPSFVSGSPDSGDDLAKLNAFVKAAVDGGAHINLYDQAIARVSRDNGYVIDYLRIDQSSENETLVNTLTGEKFSFTGHALRFSSPIESDRQVFGVRMLGPLMDYRVHKDLSKYSK